MMPKKALLRNKGRHMGAQLIRIDDRLIHGQVVIGWASYLQSKKIILCDDDVYENEWEKELYTSIVPEEMDVMILSVSETAAILNEGKVNLDDAIIVVRGPQIIEQLIEKNVKLDKINVGGIHFKEGRKNYLPYLYLNDSEVKSFINCMKKGIQFTCLDVPGGTEKKIEALLR
jgi:mannose/fructose/N-acetylgalactosamine-specific phosphotransferase system component IIB